MVRVSTPPWSVADAYADRACCVQAFYRRRHFQHQSTTKMIAPSPQTRKQGQDTSPNNFSRISVPLVTGRCGCGLRTFKQFTNFRMSKPATQEPSTRRPTRDTSTATQSEGYAPTAAGQLWTVSSLKRKARNKRFCGKPSSFLKCITRNGRRTWTRRKGFCPNLKE